MDRITDEQFIKELERRADAFFNESLIEELEQIKAEIKELTKHFYIEPDVFYIIDEHISKLKGENK